MATQGGSDVKLQMFSEKDSQQPLQQHAEGLSEKHDSGAAQLPPPNAVDARQPKEDPLRKIWPGYIIGVWIALSSSVILQNAYILNELEFHYPIFLTTFHLTYASIGTRLLLRFTNLLDGVKDVQMPWDRYFKSIVPIGALFSASLIFSNLAYLTLSVSFIQMLKAYTSVAVLGISVFMGLDKFNRRKAIIVCAISTGVALASLGEIHFELSGFICQALGIVFEATRLVSIEKLLSGMKMGPLVSLWFYAPVCATLNACLIPIYEGLAPFQELTEKVGIPFLLLNASTAFALNISVVYLIGCASSLVLTLSGVLKDILLVAGSVMIMGSTVTFTQMVGYGVALSGLFVFKTKQEVIDQAVVRVRSLFAGNR